MLLATPQRFFAEVRAGLLGPDLSPAEVDGCNALLAATEGWPLAWVAYGLGTAYHETAHTMQPVKEIGGEAYFRRMYDREGNRPHIAAGLGNVEPGDGARFAGRGYVQLTGRRNYTHADAELGLAGRLVADPDLALRADIAARILEAGMRAGWFTGKRLSTYLLPSSPAPRAAFVEARRIINGQDRADLVADYALGFQAALEAAA